MNLTYQPVKILVGATWGHRPHNFLAVGAIAPIAPMESAPMHSYIPVVTPCMLKMVNYCRIIFNVLQ